MKLSENNVREACLDLLRLHHWWPIRQHVGRFLPGRVYGLLCPQCQYAVRKHWITIGEVGDPDYAVIKAPSFFMETKGHDGVLSEEQRQKIFQLEKFHGLETVVVDGVEELMDWLTQHERSP